MPPSAAGNEGLRGLLRIWVCLGEVLIERGTFFMLQWRFCFDLLRVNDQEDMLITEGSSTVLKT